MRGKTMKIETVTVKHPRINNREITLLLVDNRIDIPSTEFLVHEARYGGRYNQIGGRTSHKGKAVKIAELYRNLNQMGVDWRNADESHLKAIRNAMLCWDKNSNPSYDRFSYEPITNDAMNQKIGVWFKFYKYMNQIGQRNHMVLRTKRIRISKPQGMLAHLNSRTGSQKEYVEVSVLRVTPSPKNDSYKALSKIEFARLRQHLRDIDVVYEMIALFMVETGLRISAALEAKESDFEGLIQLMSSGKTFNDVVKRDYIAKGDMKKQYDLPLRTIRDVNEIYLMRLHVKRMYAHMKRRDRLSSTYSEDALWLLANGKEVKKHDIWSVFSKISKQMGRTTEKITPHCLRHTFATWTIMDISRKKNIPLENTGITPSPIFIIALRNKLGHASEITTLLYIRSALKLMGIDVNDGPTKISLRSFLRDKASQELLKKEAETEFGDDFDDDYFDVVKYGLSRKIIVDDEIAT
jgi:integrase